LPDHARERTGCSARHAIRWAKVSRFKHIELGNPPRRGRCKSGFPVSAASVAALHVLYRFTPLAAPVNSPKPPASSAVANATLRKAQLTTKCPDTRSRPTEQQGESAPATAFSFCPTHFAQRSVGNRSEIGPPQDSRRASGRKLSRRVHMARTVTAPLDCNRAPALARDTPSAGSNAQARPQATCLYRWLHFGHTSSLLYASGGCCRPS